jgi:chemotaxis protein histidine kinase CheA
MQHIIDFERQKLKKTIKKTMKLISEEVGDYELYKENYDFLNHLPLVRDLRMQIKQLKDENRLLAQQYTVDSCKIKIEKLDKPCKDTQCKDNSRNQVKPKKTKHLKPLYNTMSIQCANELLVEEFDVKHIDTLPINRENIIYELSENESESDDDVHATATAIAVQKEDDQDEESVQEVQEVVKAETAPMDKEEEDAQEQDEEEETASTDQEEEEEQEEDAQEQEEETAPTDQEEAQGEEQEEEQEAQEEEPAPTEQEEEEESQEQEEEESEVYEITIKNKKYYTTSEIDGIIYKYDANGDVGDEVGQFKNGKAVFTK